MYASPLKRVLVEMHAQIKIATPVCLTFILRKSIDIVSVIFVGHLGAHFLSSCGLATVTSNVTGSAIVVGMGGALSTLASQANGGRDAEALNMSLQRAVLILPTIACMPVSLLWLFSERIMLTFGQEPALARDASHYLLLLIPSLYFMSLSICIQNWLHAQARTAAVAVVTACMALLHPLWCWLFIYYLGFGYLGAAMAVSLSRALEFGALAWYLTLGSSILSDVGFTWSLHKALLNWGPFLALGLPNIMMMMEWMASEVVIFLAGALVHPETQVSAMSIYQSTITLCFMIPSGLSVSAATRCGNALGLRDASSAARAALAAPLLAALVSCSVAGLVFAVHTSWALVFTSDRAVVRAVANILPLLTIYVVADGVQGALTGILKGLGQQRYGAPIVIFSYYVVGLPLSVALGFNWDPRSLSDGLGIWGLCVGTTVGTLMHALLYAVVVSRTRWPEEAEGVARRIAEERAAAKQRGVSAGAETGAGAGSQGLGALIDTDTEPDSPPPPRLTSPDGLTSIFDGDLDDDWNDSFDSFTNFRLYAPETPSARPIMQRVSESVGASFFGSLFQANAKASQRSEYELVQTQLDPLSTRDSPDEDDLDDLIF